MALTQQNKSLYTPEVGSAMAQYIVVTGYSEKVATSAKSASALLPFVYCLPDECITILKIQLACQKGK
jgi:hypothetical protein